MLNKRSFFYQASILAASNMVLFLLGFAYRVLLGRFAGPEGMGVYTLVIQVYAIVMSVCVSGICVAVTHVTASLNANGDFNGIRKLIRFAVFCFLGLLGILSLPILLLREEIAAVVLGDPRTANALWMILVLILLTGIENIFKAMFHGTRQVRFAAISEVGEQLMRIVLAWMLLTRYLNGDHGYTAFLILLGMTLSEVFSVLFLGVSYGAKFPRGRKSAAKATHDIRRRFLKIAVPAASTSVLANVFSSVSVVIFPSRLALAGYTRVEAVSALGLMSGMVLPILMLPNAFVGALCTMLMPSISGSIARGDSNDFARKVDKGIEAAGLLGIPSTAMLLPFIPLLCRLLYGQTVPPTLAAALFIQTVATYYLILTVSILNGLGMQKKVFLLAAIGEILQFALVWVLTAMPALHVYGYILGMLCGDVVRISFGLICIHRATHTRPHFFHAGIVPVACAVILYACARLLFLGVPGQGAKVIPALLASLLLCICVYIVLLQLLGVRLWPYMQRVVLHNDPAQAKPTAQAEDPGH
ncbi:MAG TPA: oligosaccharide flippase family protein [Clostridia bacterium]|nr:oligosaccharide flippase family protein [Clostridia bacterium]